MEIWDLVFIGCSVLIFVAALLLIQYSFTRARPVHLLVAERDTDEQPNQVRARGVPRGEGGGPRRRVRQNRLAVARNVPADSSSDSDVEDNEDDGDDAEGPSKSAGKVGAKKLRKMEEKEAKKANREAMEEARKERRENEEKQMRKRKQDEEAKEKEEAAKEAEEQRLKEEQARREYEEYLELKKQFSVESEGTDAQDEHEIESLLKEFISYIEQMKVVMLEDLAAHFKLKTQEVIDRVKTLQSEGRLSGVIDDRGKFICITGAEYEAVAKFIKQRGRVSISDLADSMNRLIRLQPEVNTSATANLDVAVCS